MKPVAMLAALGWLTAQNAAPPAGDAARPLAPAAIAEIGALRASVQTALRGRTFRLVLENGADGPDVLMGPGGRPRTIRYTVRAATGGGATNDAPAPPDRSRRTAGLVWTEITDFVGAARRCDGARADGEMVAHYRREGAGGAWTSSLRPRGPYDAGGPALASLFEMLSGAIPADTGERQQIGGRPVRALVSAWSPAGSAQAGPPRAVGDPLPDTPLAVPASTARQTLWIDVRSRLPVRWDVDVGGGNSSRVRFAFRRLDLGPPAGVTAPACLR